MSWDLISDTRPVARKNYKCIWCGEKIPIGEKHVHTISNYCGDFQNHRFHNECNDAMDEHCSKQHDGEFEPYRNERPLAQQALARKEAGSNSPVVV